MALNNLLGFQLSAKDDASLTFLRVGKSLGALKTSANEAGTEFDGLAGRMRDSTSGRFTKKPTGVLDSGMWSEVGAKTKEAGMAMVGFGVATIAALGYASMKAAEFEKAIALVASEADTAIFPQKEMARITQELGEKFGRLPVQEANALYKAVALGANDATKATQIMTGANLLAVAGNADLELTMNALGGALNAYGGDMSKATDFSDTLFTTMKNGNTTVGELAASIGHITSEAANLKIPFTELMGAVAVMTNKGVAAAEAVTGLKAALQSVQHPTSDAAAEAARLGIKFNQAELRAKGLPAFLKEITSSSKFTAESMSKLFAGEGANAIAMVVGDAEAFSNVMKEMGNRAGATQKGFEVMSDTVDFQAQKINALKDSALILIGSALKPMAVHVMKFGVMALQWFTKLSPTIIKVGAVLAAVVGVLSTVVGSALVVGVAIGGLIVAAKAIAIGIGVAVAAFAIMALAMVPIIAYAYLLYNVWTKNLGGIQERVAYWFGKIKLAFTALYEVFTTGGFSDAIFDELNAGNQDIKEFAITAFLWFNRIKNFFVHLGESFSTGLTKVGPTIDKIFAAITRIIGVFGVTQDSASGAKDQFEAFGATGDKVGSFLVKVVDFIAAGILNVVSFTEGAVKAWVGFKPVLSAVWGAVTELWGAFTGLFDVFGKGSKDSASSADIWKEVGTILGWVANIGVYTMVTAFRILGGVFSVVGGIFGAIGAIFDGVVNAIVIGIKFVVAIFKGDFKGALDLAVGWFENLGNTIINVITKIIGGVAGMVDSLGKIFKVDLGLKGKVEGIGKGLSSNNGGAPATPPPAVTAPTPGTAPGVAAQQTQLKAMEPGAVSVPGVAPLAPPITVKSTLVIDGKVLAEATSKQGAQDASRSFAPTPAPA